MTLPAGTCWALSKLPDGGFVLEQFSPEGRRVDCWEGSDAKALQANVPPSATAVAKVTRLDSPRMESAWMLMDEDMAGLAGGQLG